MATLATTKLTLLDHARRTDPDGSIANIVEVMNQTNEIIRDIPWIEANDAESHLTTVRSGIPDSTWRYLNYGTQPTKSTTVQVTDTMGELTQLAIIDEKLVKRNGNSAAFRLSENTPHIEGMMQDFATALFYGNTSIDPEKFMGLSPRFNLTTAQNGGNIISGSGSGSDNHSVWLVGWSPSTIHGIYPKGSKAGVDHQDMGVELVDDSASPAGKYRAYRDTYSWDCGISVRDWRYVVRIANIDNSDLTYNAASGARLIELMIRAIHKIRNPNLVNLVFYANETVKTFLDLQTVYHSNVNLMYKDLPHGENVLTFRGIPIRRCDALLATEATVS